ncbi:MFS transporter [Paenibacillus larvae]|uniref:MFS transporter n=1 Tax=Paenibacillus larvae TaxID=1464 RepID=A0AAP5JV79_9BACL|nr:MFS transporter [Paenibacillus larvae]AQR78024.1 MFS transporter [Paenibacillus larvae subsp. larvae]AVF20813.1 multidrug efflux protein YfmO [Paenibacillus larvae subsp. larvae]ETK28219.1 multidrug efflux protein YfmO [Paenibacillus larvae subsp. larvae DSM 25719]MCY7490014.1 MFS transporter [Paenibacillus larvae]MCY9564250.1 MFS transporter [Paenibacillus larvae]
MDFQEKEDRQTKTGRYITVFASFLVFMGIGVVDPILPVIAEQIGANEWQVEMLFTAYILVLSLMMIPAGLLSAKLGDKRMVVTGLPIVTVFAMLCAVSNNIPQLAIFRAGWGLGNSLFMATAMTLLISLTPKMRDAVGLYEAAMGLGMAGGPLLGGLLGSYSWRAPFFATSMLVLLAFVLVMILVKEPERKAKRKVTGTKELFRLIKYRPFLKVALSSMFYYYGFFVILAYSPLVLHLSAIQLGFVFFGWGILLAAGSAVLAHRLEESFRPQVIIPFSIALSCIWLILLFVTQTVWLQVILIISSGLILGFNNALFTSHIMEVSPYERSITSGAYNFVRWMGAAIAPIASGALGHLLAPRSPFLVAALIGACGFIFMIVRPNKEVLVKKLELDQ